MFLVCDNETDIVILKADTIQEIMNLHIDGLTSEPSIKRYVNRPDYNKRYSIYTDDPRGQSIRTAFEILKLLIYYMPEHDVSKQQRVIIALNHAKKITYYE